MASKQTSQSVTACMECKRMKLRCDKKIPCGSCVRRGCSAICPTGKLAPGRGTRYILDGTEELHSQIQRLRTRVQILEDTLAGVYSQISTEPHPLLIKQGEDDYPTPAPSASSPEHEDENGNQKDEVQETVDFFGTLAVEEFGNDKYLGPSAGTESLFQVAASELNDSLDFSSTVVPLDQSLLRLSSQFPLGMGIEDLGSLATVVAYFPEQLRASSLCELYTEQFAFAYTPILREELIDDLFAPTYRVLKTLQISPDMAPSILRPHRCAVLFLVFAIGAWVDLTEANYWEEADKYYQLGRACLSMQSVVDSPEFATVQALNLVAIYLELRGAPTLHPSWLLISLASKIGQSLGLHRDTSRWNSDPIKVNRQRHLFWDMLTMEGFQCLSLGRPISIRNTYVDAKIAYGPGVDRVDNESIGFFPWKHEFVRRIYSRLTEVMMSAHPPKYEALLDLDRMIREIPIPPHLNRIMAEDPKGDYDHITSSAFFQACLPSLFRSTVILFIHRVHYTKALQHPKNPLMSPFAPSFLAAYRAATWMAKAQRVLWKKTSGLSVRFWHPWTHLISASMMLGCLIIYHPSSPMATGALNDLDAMCAIYRAGVSKSISQRIQNGWKMIQRIHARATEAYANHKDSRHSPEFDIPSCDFGDDELALFGGQTRVLYAKSTGNTPSPPQITDQSPSPEPQPTVPFRIGENKNINVHPSLIQFLNNAPTTQVASFNELENFATSSFISPEPNSFSSSLPAYIPVQSPPWQLPNTQPDPSYNFGDAQWQTTMNIDPSIGAGAQDVDMEKQWTSFLQQMDFMPK